MNVICSLRLYLQVLTSSAILYLSAQRTRSTETEQERSKLVPLIRRNRQVKYKENLGIPDKISKVISIDFLLKRKHDDRVRSNLA